ncbi:MAG: DegV family protein, partial [Clostridia bacterium]|nr:DegV family protein [Clostridia bacterium]
MKVAIVSDTNSGLLPEKAKSLGVHLIPMPFMINGDVYYEGVNLSQDAFYAMLDDKTTDISTSPPSVAVVLVRAEFARGGQIDAQSLDQVAKAQIDLSGEVIV